MGYYCHVTLIGFRFWQVHSSFATLVVVPTQPGHKIVLEVIMIILLTNIPKVILHGKYAFQTFEEMMAVLSEVEATLNSRPLLPAHHSFQHTTPSTLSWSWWYWSADIGTLPYVMTLTFPARVYSANKVCNLNWWNLVNLLVADLWDRWCTAYLQSLQQRQKWKCPVWAGSNNSLRQENISQTYWKLAPLNCGDSPAQGRAQVQNFNNWAIVPFLWT